MKSTKKNRVVSNGARKGSVAPRDSSRKMSKVVVQHRSDMLMQEQVIVDLNPVYKYYNLRIDLNLIIRTSSPKLTCPDENRLSMFRCESKQNIRIDHV